MDDHRRAEVLLVEDNPGDVRLMIEAFHEGGPGAHISVARDGAQALPLSSWSQSL